MRRFFNETRKAWAASATIFGGMVIDAVNDGGGVTDEEWLLILVGTGVSWVVTWATPNDDQD